MVAEGHQPLTGLSHVPKTHKSQMDFQKYLRRAKAAGLTGKEAIKEAKRRAEQAQESFDEAFKGTDYKASLGYANKVGQGLHRSNAKFEQGVTGLQWRKDGNIGDVGSFPLDPTHPDYNLLYAVYGHDNWPVPVPISSASAPQRSYAAGVGRLNGSITLAGDRDFTTEYVLEIEPNNVDPVKLYKVDSIRQARWYVVRGQPPPETRNMWQVGWTGAGDPRELLSGQMFGTWVEGPTKAGHLLYAQHMGGHAELTVTTSWNEQATVSVLDPMTCPGFIGNKMNGATYPARAVDGERFRYYGIGDMDKEDQPVMSLKGMCANSYALVGSSADARVVLEQRVLPNTQEWVLWTPPGRDEAPWADAAAVNRWYCEHGGISPYVGFTGTGPLYFFSVPPNGELSLKVDVWLSYNVQLDPSTSVGKLLFLESPVTVFHACDINLLPTGVACDAQATVAQQQLSSAYSGGRVNKAIRTSTGYTGRSLQAASIPKENFLMRISNWVKNTGAPTARSVIGAIKAAIETGKAIGGMF